MPRQLVRLLMVAAAGALLWSGASAVAQDLKINIGLGAPAIPPPVVVTPPLVVVPGTSVYYAPDVSANVFFYKGRYYTVANGVWSTAPAPSGPWVVLQMGKVPAPVLSVPTTYDKIPSGHLKKAGPPPWAGPKKHKDESVDRLHVTRERGPGSRETRVRTPVHAVIGLGGGVHTWVLVEHT